MQKIKKLIKPTLLLLTTFLIYFLILTTLHYTGLLKLSSISKINFFIIALVSLISGFTIGKKTSKKGYLEGLKLGLIICSILLLLNAILYRTFSLYLLIYYIVILSSTTIGSMIGINLKH